MEPTLILPDSLRPVLAELEALEPLYHAAHADATPEHFERLVAPQFWEVGAAGRRYSRDFALAVLKNRSAPADRSAWQTRDFHLIEAGTDHYLLTYTLIQPGRVTLRSTLWRRLPGGGWHALYHQGTIAPPMP